MAMANLAMINAHLPMKIIVGFEVDYNKWYPAYRRVPLLAHVPAADGCSSATDESTRARSGPAVFLASRSS